MIMAARCHIDATGVMGKEQCQHTCCKQSPKNGTQMTLINQHYGSQLSSAPWNMRHFYARKYVNQVATSYVGQAIVASTVS